MLMLMLTRLYFPQGEHSRGGEQAAAGENAAAGSSGGDAGAWPEERPLHLQYGGKACCNGGGVLA